MISVYICNFEVRNAYNGFQRVCLLWSNCKVIFLYLFCYTHVSVFILNYNRIFYSCINVYFVAFIFDIKFYMILYWWSFYVFSIRIKISSSNQLICCLKSGKSSHNLTVSMLFICLTQIMIVLTSLTLTYRNFNRDTPELRIFWVFPANPGVQINFYS